LISKDEGVPMISADFDHLIEEIRSSMSDPAGAASADVFRTYDHEGMMFISLAELSSEEFQVFVAVVRSAMKICVQNHRQVLAGVWTELVHALIKDPRCGDKE
jgi:hypothetical protein